MQELLDDLERLERQSPNPKLKALLNWLGNLHNQQPDLKVLVFSEYADTVEAIFEFLQENGHDGKVVKATGEDPDADQRAAIDEFLFGNACVLVTTDIAGEGLNLHYTCHHLVHFELPWNPNRLEQRNGRIDRYGQTKPPVIAPGENEVFLRAGFRRKQTGTYFTHPALVNFLVRKTLEPLTQDKTPEELLQLKIVDPAMGSGHFLVGACRFPCGEVA